MPDDKQPAATPEQPVTHEVTVNEGANETFAFAYGSGPFQAECTCGWAGNLRATCARAEKEGAEHLAMFAPPLEDTVETHVERDERPVKRFLRRRDA